VEGGGGRNEGWRISQSIARIVRVHPSPIHCSKTHSVFTLPGLKDIVVTLGILNEFYWAQSGKNERKAVERWE
jgi:hypothetical protein